MTSWSCSEPCKQVIHLLKPIPSSQWQAIWHKCFNNLLVWVRTLQPFLLILATQLLLHSIYLFPHNHIWPSLSHMLHLPCVHNYTQNKFPPLLISPTHHQPKPNPHLTHHHMGCPHHYGHSHESEYFIPSPNTYYYTFTTSFYLFSSYKYLHPTHTSLHSTTTPILLSIQPTSEPMLPPTVATPTYWLA
jgi:hypothetical protein